MALSTFHLFPQLPYELRLQIWDSAIRKKPTIKLDSSGWDHDRFDAVNWLPEIPENMTYGIHYVRLDHKGDFIPLDCNWNNPHPVNRSACLWHAGLWMACKESRQVMQKRWFGHPYYNDAQEEVDEQVNDGLRKWFYRNGEGVDVICDWWAQDQEEYEPWLMATSAGDMFCITPASYNPLSELKRSASRGDMSKYAVEFDPSWTSELAGLDKYQPTYHLPPTLAFAIKIFYEIATMDMRLPSVINLIDRHSGWKSVSNTENSPVFYDCEHEYIQIDPSNPCASNHIVQCAPMLRFLDQVDRLLKNILTNKRKTSLSAWGDCTILPDGLSVRKLVRVMVRRDKEVVLEAAKSGNVMGRRVRRPASVVSSNGKAAGQKPAVRWRW
ncbi:hypothetical protein ACKLNR_011351 [Fusarium oxysporum f. sp. zingiberi]